MLKIRPDQIQEFEDAALLHFEDEMVLHVKESSLRARLCEVIGDEQLRVVLRQAMERATGYGLSYRGPMRLYIELAFLFGSDFDTDPQYPPIGKILKASGEQMQRAEQIHEWVLDFQDRAYGPQAVNVRSALKALSDLAQKPDTFTADNLVARMLQEMARAFPQKAAYIGEEGLTTLIHEGCTEARKHRFPIRGEAMMTTLMFAFGHGCPKDPLYPWIERTLKDERIVDPEARAKRLEKKAVTWLEHVLSRPSKEVLG